MKSTAILVGVLSVALVITAVFAISNGYAQPKDEGAAVQAAETNIYINKTCSGKEAVENPEKYVFGMTDSQGACMTRTFLANDPDEAYMCAKKLCPDCRIEDISWMGRFSSPADALDNIDNYCPAH